MSTDRFTIGTIELDSEPFSGVDGGKIKDAAIPTDAGGRISPAERVVPFAGKCGSF